MEPFSNWEEVATSNPTNRVPLPHEDFDQYFTGYNEVDNMFNETLTGLQDLDVPSGFVNQDLKQQDIHQNQGHLIKHSRGMSGTAIFGFAEHNRELSISGLAGDLYKTTKPSMDIGKSIYPGELLNSLHGQGDQPVLPSAALDFDFPEEIQKPLHFAEEEEYEYAQSNNIKKDSKQDYIVTNKNPRSYKFPPSPNLPTNKVPEPVPESNKDNQFKSVNQYSVKYLQDLNKFNDTAAQKTKQEKYVDNIGPLLGNGAEEGPVDYNNPQALYATLPESQSTPFNNNTVYKYVPIPTQSPAVFQNTTLEQNKPEQKSFPLNIKDNLNAYLPPPSTPGLTNGSPDWNSSPEPQSPSPNRAVLNTYQNNSRFSSPIRSQLRNDRNGFYVPQFFSDDNRNTTNGNILNNHIASEQHSSPVCQLSLNSSPIKYYTSPLRNAPTTEDDTMDANATITQLTPLKGQVPLTPLKNKVTLEWSPIISPNAKSSKDVKKALQESSPRRRVKKTSLLPPGELDQYWDGPDENKVFTCTYKNCGKKFTRRYNVRSHIQTHLSDRPFPCSYCPKKFVRQHDLNRHVKGHLEARYCKCLCGKEFSRLDALKKHRARNICIGGVISNENHCVTKPQKRDKTEILDGVTSERLAEDIQAIFPTSESLSPSA